MSGRRLAPGDYAYGDLRIGDFVETAEAGITTDMIDRFADLTGDRFEIHMSEESARRKGFPARVAHGLLVLSVIDGLKNQTPAQFRAVATLSWDWAFRRPVLAGDRIRGTFTIEEMRETRNETRGILRLSVEVRNQTGEVIQQGVNHLMVMR